jgi:hypothetical protein
MRKVAKPKIISNYRIIYLKILLLKSLEFTGYFEYKQMDCNSRSEIPSAETVHFINKIIYVF